MNSIADQEKGVEENPLVPLQNWFLFAPEAHKWLQLPKAPSEDGIKAAAPTHQPIFTSVPHKTEETLFTVTSGSHLKLRE